MEYFAIRQKSTGKFLPASKRRMGFTNDEPTSTEELPPRLFTRMCSATQALNWWLGGKHTTQWTSSHSMWGEDDHMEIVAVPTPNTRRPEDMEIVTIKLEVRHEDQA